MSVIYTSWLEVPCVLVNSRDPLLLLYLLCGAERGVREVVCGCCLGFCLGGVFVESSDEHEDCWGTGSEVGESP